MYITEPQVDDAWRHDKSQTVHKQPFIWMLAVVLQLLKVTSLEQGSKDFSDIYLVAG